MRHFFSILMGTFVLEDVALASSLALIDAKRMTFFAAFLACFLGICLGDIGLYWIGYAASRYKIGKNSKLIKKYGSTLLKLKRSNALPYSIVISRVIPGTRLPTYLSAGFLRYSFFKFLALTLGSVFLWVLIALVGGRSLNSFFMGRWVINTVIFLACLNILKSLIPKLADPWERKALHYSWRRWMYFEFWPAWFFYLPIVPYYFYLSFKFKSFFMPFYASPEIANGGLIGESKWDYLKYLKADESSTLKAFKLDKDADFSETKEILEREGFSYPFIMKPDVGQRGFGVRIIRNDYDLTEYLLLSDFEKIIQQLSDFQAEAGLFYIRRPSEVQGKLFSITDKKFPFVTGDGMTKLGDLILRDKRARIIASVYFSRLREKLDCIPAQGEIVPLAECGNHSQGTIFLNGKHLITVAFGF